ncbi:MAG: cytochrome c [Hymenobacteraceae bacterium]|nr:cytochrome c [Hymenobacteraceae bacterium]MDX5480333.1 cytochrome c [Hymenobacteraceae bacterium]
MLKTILIATILTSGFGYTLTPKTPAPAKPADALKESIQRGEKIYAANCQSCHMPEGEGMPGVFPPLAKSDYLMKDQKRAIRSVLHGVTGAITVNGQQYNMDMPAQNYLSDQEVADVLNYIQNNWGNKAKAVTPAQVKAERKK